MNSLRIAAEIDDVPRDVRRIREIASVTCSRFFLEVVLHEEVFPEVCIF